MTIPIFKKITLLNQAALDSLENDNKSRITKIFIEIGVQILGAYFGFAWWKPEGKQEYELAYKSAETPYAPNPPRKFGGNYAAQKNRSPVFVPSAQKEQYPKKYDVTPYMKSYVIIPITYKNTLYGNLVFCFKEKHLFGKEDKCLCVALGNSAAQAITIHRLIKNEQQAKMEKVRQKALDALERKDDFISILAHELRNPMMPLLQSLELIELQNGKNTAIQQNLSVAIRQARKLKNILNSILDVSKFLHGQTELKLKTIDAREIVHHVIENEGPAFKKENLKCNIKLPRKPFYITADPLYLDQILTNLFSNSIKYNNPGGNITIVLKREKGDAKFSIKDSGIGITREHLPHVFDLFFRSDKSRKRLKNGLGIGLSLAKKLAEMHGGSLMAYSGGANKGSEFTLRIPIRKKGGAYNATSKPSTESNYFKPQSAKKNRVLVVDDSKDLSDTLKKTILMLGQECKNVYNGKSAIKFAPKFKPDFIFIDIGMPGMDGYETIKNLKKKLKSGSVKFIALTGYGRPEDYQYSKDAGFDFHLTKPASTRQIEEILQL